MASNNFSTLGKSAFIAAIGIVFQKLSKFILIYLQLQYLGLELYGVFVVSSSYVMIISGFQSLGLQGAIKHCVQFFIEKDVERLWSIFLASILLPIIAGMFISAIILCVISFMNISSDLHYAFLIFTFFLPIIGTSEISLLLTTSFETNFYFTIGRDILAPALEIFLLSFFTFFSIWDKSIFLVILSFSIGKISMYFLAIYGFSQLCKKNRLDNPKIQDWLTIIFKNYEHIKKVIFYCFPLLLGNLFLKTTQFLDILILNSLVDKTLVAKYKIATVLAYLVSSVSAITLNMFSSIVGKYYQKKMFSDIKRVYLESIMLSLLLGLPAVLVLIVFASDILLYFSHGAVDATWAMQIMILGQVFQLITGGTGMILSMTDKAHLHAINNAIFFLFHGVCCYILTNIFSIDGAALATATSLILINITKCIQVKYYYKFTFISSFNIKIILFTTFMGYIITYTKGLFEIRLLNILFACCISYLTIWIVSWFYFINNQDKENMANLILSKTNLKKSTG